MRICFYQNEKSPPEPAEISRDDLIRCLSDFRRGPCTTETCIGDKCPHKYGPAWSPTELVPGAEDRCVENIAAVTAAVYDLDDISADLGWLERLVNSGLGCVLHSSHRHKPDAIRLRLLLWLDEPVPASRWLAFWNEVARRYEIPADPACKDASRLYFLPSAPIGAEIERKVFPGRDLNTAEILAALPAPQMPAPSPIAIPVRRDNVRPREIADLLIPAWPKKGRHVASLALSGALARQGWDVDAIAECTTLIGAAVNGDDGEPHKRQRQAYDSVTKLGEGNRVTGFTYLEAYGVPEDVITRVQDRLYVNTPESRHLRKLFDQFPRLDGCSGSCMRQEDKEADALDGLFLDNIRDRKQPPVRLYTTGVEALDKLTGGGFATGYIWTTLAPPGNGKSAWMINAALAAEEQVPILIVTTELDAREYAARFDAHISDVAWRDLVTGEAKATVKHNGKRIAILEYAQLPHATDEALAFIARVIAMMRSRFGVSPILMMDYLQDFANRAHSDFRVGVTVVSRALLSISKQEDCAVVLISSVSRAWYGQAKAEALRQSEDPGIYLSAGKESGGIDFDSAVVMFIDLDHESKLARFAIAKARRGDLGFVGMEFHGASGRWCYKPEAATMLLQKKEGSKAGNTNGRAETDDAQALNFIRELHPAMLPASENKFVNLISADDAHPMYLPQKRARAAFKRLVTRNELILQGGVYVIAPVTANIE